jgi:hypothetical protein
VGWSFPAIASPGLSDEPPHDNDGLEKTIQKIYAAPVTRSPGTVQHPDARSRWDRAYQSIVRWSLGTEGAASNPSANGKDEYHVEASTFGPRPPGGRSSPKIEQRVRKHLRE